MIKRIKRLSKDSIFYGFGMAFSQLFSFVLAPILTAKFTPTEFGIMSLLQTTFGFMIVIALINLTSGVYFYYFDDDDVHNKKVIISTSIFFHVIVAIFFSVVIWMSASYFSDLLNMRQVIEDEVDYTRYIQILAFGLFFSIMDTQFKSLLRMLRKPKLFAILTAVQVAVNFIAVILLVVVYDFRIEGAFYAAIIASITAVLVGFFMVKDEYVKAFSFVYLGLFFSYALPQFPSVFFNWGLSQSNRFFLNYYADLNHMGIYSIGFKIATIFLLFATAFRMAWDPFALSIMKQKDAKETYRKFYNYFIILFIWFASNIAFFGKSILILLTPEEYHSAYIIIGILSFAFFSQAANNILGIGISISKRTKYISYIQFWVFVAVVLLSVWLIPDFGSLGAALVFLAGSQVQSILYYLIAERLYRVDYDYKKMYLFSMGIFVISYAGMLYIEEIDTFASSAMMAAAFSVVVLILSLGMLGVIEKEFWFGIKKLVQKRSGN